MDPKEALQYVYILPLSSDSTSPVGQEQLEAAWELVRRIIVLGNSGPSTNANGNTNSVLAWEELVGGVRPDGTRFVSPFLSFLSCSFTQKNLVWCPPESPSPSPPISILSLLKFPFIRYPLIANPLLHHNHSQFYRFPSPFQRPSSRSH
ncbi:hypothetical protein BT96DRAFT_919019 [Gymnopus androsaceus JB14]|uniref:Uncharacterized protein n=1 Tax=Gymnopus androsaceus JB14 TaxID=1447944 RepID=A0A6A4HSU6_9AGAR|nr:hypothetical protein BT96DRAFT_919019 [Gymnopus androsaceus JB14]